MNTEAWICYYQKNTGSFVEPDWAVACEMEEGAGRRALADSLAIFQIGETGDGSTLQKWAVRECGQDPRLAGYPAAVKLFIREENFHADLLAKMVGHLGGRLREKHWAAWAFNRVRKLIPRLEYEIQILLSAELIARAYYGLLARQVPEAAIQRCCARLVKDEIKHIAFHAEFFRERFESWTPAAVGIWRMQFRFLFQLAAWLVWWNHRPAFVALGITRGLYAGRCRASLVDFLRQVAPAPQTATSGDHVEDRLPT